jgi:secreted trypsin-like serine protease
MATVPITAPAYAIARGEAVPDGEYPFAVKITDVDIPTADGGDRDSSCSAGLISPHWILTAGHCFRDAAGRRVSRTVAAHSYATVGRADLTSDDGQQADIVAVKQSGVADVALAKLNHAITGITPLAVSRQAPRVGTIVRLTGYGLTTPTGTKLPQRLQTGRFRVSSVARTEIGMTGTSPHATTSPCKHDSGGPYFTQSANGRATVVAVVSHGPDCPHTGPDTAGRIDTVASWIQSIIGKDVLPSPSPSKSATGVAPSRSAGAIAAPPNAPNAPSGPGAPAEIPALAWVAVPAVGAFAIGGFTMARSQRRRRRRPPSRHRRR